MPESPSTNYGASADPRLTVPEVVVSAPPSQGPAPPPSTDVTSPPTDTVPPSEPNMGLDPLRTRTRQQFYRHALPVRISHWLAAISVFILIMSGLQIFNAHPALYWGNRSDRQRALLAIEAYENPQGELRGITEVFGFTFDTTGVLGVIGGEMRTFPAWATIPSTQWLAMGRRWHIFFAWLLVLNGLFFGLYALASRHLWRDLWPGWRNLRYLKQEMLNHLRLRRPQGEEALHYNLVQKCTYFGVIFVIGPLIVLTGLAMSPWMGAAFPVLLAVFGGRQAARTLHFVVCFAFVGFIAVHLLMVTVTGLWNNLRSMLTGWYDMRLAGRIHHG